jgi:iduronate 2-sulfatase
MIKPKKLLRLSVLIWMFGLVLADAGRVDAASKPNVLFLICDDLNCDLGCYGHTMVRSPNIDRLAARGLRFEHAYCQYPLCGPSRASFMAGLYPDQTLIRRNAIRIRERIPNILTMSQLFRRHGYTATRVGKIYHYNVPADIGNDGHDDAASWDHTVNPRGRDKDEESKVFTLLPGRYGGTLSWLAADGTDLEQTDGIAATAAIKILEKHAQDDTPFFLAVGLYRPHTPYVSPKRYFEMYPRDQIRVPKLPDGYLKTIPAPAQASVTRKKDQVNLPDDLARQAIQAYYASITFADAQVGRVLDGLKRLGLAENTIVVFTSDHGYHMGEHGHWQKTTLFENAARVPLIISVPGMKTAGKSSASFAEMIDFYPTLAELCELPRPGHLSGISLKPALDDATAKPRKVAFTQYGTGYSIRTARYRYTAWGVDGRDGDELYDHTSDPEEMVNLAEKPAYAKHVTEFSQILSRRIARAGLAPKGVKQIEPKPRSKSKSRRTSKAGDSIDFKPVLDYLKLPDTVTLGKCSAVDIDSNGRLYLFHRGKQPILCFDRSGNFIRSWGDDLIGMAHGLRIDGDDNIWVTDIGHHMVFKFSPKGKLLLAMGKTDKPGLDNDQFNKPTDIAFGTRGEIYVSDGYGNSRVMKFASNGKFLSQWGRPGKGRGEFNLPHAILVDAKGRVIVGDRENDRIQIFNSEGILLEVWPGFAPFGMELDTKGDLFVADGRASKVLRIDSNGTVNGSWGRKGSGPGEFNLPHMLASDSAGNLYVAEVGGMRLQKLLRKR